jgi:hypothetical protein
MQRLTSFDSVLKDSYRKGAKMPATSKAQAIAMSIAEHEPSKLFARNRGLTKMSHSQLHDFASTKRKGLPDSRVKKSMRAVIRGR